MATRSYSYLFSCLHDEAEPIGNLGRGTHHSVCRAVTWVDPDLTSLPAPKIHDFAIIWDEDHDERVIPVVEGLLMASLLAPVLFIGERKGCLTVVVDAALFDGTAIDSKGYAEKVEKVCEANSGGDYWPSSVVTLQRTTEGLSGADLCGLVDAEVRQVLNYLRGIDVLWSLGVQAHWRRVAVDQ